MRSSLDELRSAGPDPARSPGSALNGGDQRVGARSPLGRRSVRGGRGRFARSGTCRVVCGEARHRALARVVRRAARGPRGRRRVHRAAECSPLRSGRCARWRRGSYVYSSRSRSRWSSRSKVRASAGGRAERRGLVLLEGYMWRHSAQDEAPAVARAGAWGAAGGQLVVLRPGAARARRAVRPELSVAARSSISGATASGRSVLSPAASQTRSRGLPGVVAAVSTSASRERCSSAISWRRSRVRSTGSSTCSRSPGTEGVLSVPHAFSDPDGVVVVNGVEHRAAARDDYRNQLADFCAAIRGEDSPLLTRADTLGQAQALDALLRRRRAQRVGTASRADIQFRVSIPPRPN